MYFVAVFLLSAFVCGTFAQTNSPLVAPELTLASDSKIQQIDFNYLVKFIGELVNNYNTLIARLSDPVKNNFDALKTDTQNLLTNGVDGTPLPLEISTYDDFENWIQAAKAADKTAIDDLGRTFPDFQATYSRDDHHVIFVKKWNDIFLLGRFNILELIVMIKNNKYTGPFAGILKALIEQFGNGVGADPIGAIWKFIQNSNLGDLIGISNFDVSTPASRR